MTLSTRIVALWNRLAALTARDAADAEVDEEMRFHREQLERDAVATGMSAEDARFAARRRFGNSTYLNEENREMWRIQPVETLVQDIRYAVRFLRRSPGFTLVAVLSLALGIGANTAVFTLINAVLVRTLPVANPEDLVVLNGSAVQHMRTTQIGPLRTGIDTEPRFSYPHFRALDTVDAGIDGLFASARTAGLPFDRGNGESAMPNGAMLVSGGYFTTLGVRPAIGRLFVPNDDRLTDASPIIVLGYDFWTSAFGGDTAIIGKTILVAGRSMQIVGVTPPEFFGTQVGDRVDAYLPLSMTAALNNGNTSQFTEKSLPWLSVMGRLRPNVTRTEAAARLSFAYRRLLAADPPLSDADAPTLAGWAQAFIVVADGSGGIPVLRRQFSKPLWILASMSALALLIACTNLASLLAARAAARRREIAIRLSMGAGRRRLLRQLLTESLILSLVGGALGVLFAYVADRALLAIATQGRPALWITVIPDARILAFTGAIAMVTGILFGIAPALQSTSEHFAATLRDGGAAGRGRGTMNLGKVLIATQVAFSVLLLFGASLFVRSLQRLYSNEIGFERSNIVLIRMNPRAVGYRGSALGAVYTDILARVAAVPGVRAVASASHAPFSGSESSFDGRVDGFPQLPGVVTNVVRVNVSPAYFRTMGIALRSGRLLTDADAGGGGGPRVAVVNERFVRKYVPSGRPLGRRFYRSSNDSTGVEIVGVVADTKYNSFRDSVPALAYWLFASDTLFPGAQQTLFVRTDPRIPNVLLGVRAAIASVDAKIQLPSVRLLSDQIDATIANERIVASLSGFFGLFALALAMIGLYGLMAYTVTTRTREFGVRMALGADGGRVARDVMRDAFVLVGIGLAIGVPAALAVSRVGRALLYGMTPTDVPTMIMTAGMLVAVAGVAAAVPAMRAARIDPAKMLRAD